MKIAICDDDKYYLNHAAELTQDFLKAYSLHAEIKKFHSSSDLLDRIEAGEEFDFFLLDIVMPGMNGLEIAAELRSKNNTGIIIFLTESPDFALRAFEVHATHYLLKPYTAESFFDAMKRGMIALPNRKSKGIMLKIDGAYRYIMIDDIIYCQSEDNYQRIFLKNGKEHLVRITSIELFSLLSKHEIFFHCGRSYILNLSHISQLSSGSAIMCNEKNVAVPRTSYRDLKAAFFNYHS